MEGKTESGLIKFQASFSGYDMSKISKSGEDDMIEQTAAVVSVEGGYAWILPQRTSGGCGGCASKTSCSSSASPFDFFRADREPQKMRVLNPLYARPGDTVVVGMQGDALIIYSLLAYLLPLVSLIVFAILGHAVFGVLGLGAEAGAILSGTGGLFGGLKFANILCSRSFRSEGFQPVILRIQGQQPVLRVPLVV
jgi:sigma-E factor negative regulatory protein RseC